MNITFKRMNNQHILCILTTTMNTKTKHHNNIEKIKTHAKKIFEWKLTEDIKFLPFGVTVYAN